MNLFQLGDFTLNSGAKSAWKIECDALTEKDIDCLADMIRQLVMPFSSVEGVPRGGIPLAVTLASFTTPGVDRHLIVDDVLTTGGSMERLRESVVKHWPAIQGGKMAPEIIGAVIFARGPCPYWIRALFPMPPSLWIKK